MSQEIFIRGIVSLVISVTMFLTIEYRYEEEMDRKNREGKRQKYLPYISTGLLIGTIFGRIIYELLTYGIGAAKHMTISICFEIFLHISLYYFVLILLISFFRKRISARVCAALWMLPNYLYLMLYGTMQLQKPFWIVRIPKNFAEVVFYVWLMGFSFVLLRGIIVHLRFRSAILKNAKGVEDEEILGLWNVRIQKHFINI